MHTINCIGVNCVCDKIINVNSIKYLGIIFYQYLRWNLQIEYITNTVRIFFYRLKTLREILNNNYLRLVYTSLVQCTLCYDLVLWGNFDDVLMHKLNITINPLLRFISKKLCSYRVADLYCIDLNIKSITDSYIICYSLLSYCFDKNIDAHKP